MRRFFIPFCLLLVILSCGGDTGTRQIGQARISGISPSTVNRGQKDVEASIHGVNLEGMSSVSLGDGVDIYQATLVSPAEIKLGFSVASDAAPGPRTITVYAVEGTVTLENAFQVSDNHVPRASFTVTPPSGYRSTSFRFDASNSNDPDGGVADYRWNFEDGRTASGKVVTHKFDSAGSFNVRLSTIDSRGASATAERFVEVAISRPPEAEFTVTPFTGTLSTDFRFDASSSRDRDGRITTYSWSFGDGTTSSGPQVSHRFSRTGLFTVNLSVTDDTRVSDAATRVLRVEDSGGDDDDDDDGGGTGQECREYATRRQPILYGSLLDEDRSTQSITVQFPPGTTCREAYVPCGDLRKTSPERFYGIIQRVYELGSGRFRIVVDCPVSWPADIGEGVFIIYKKCDDNFCP